MKLCVTCNLEHPDISHFCKACGQPLVEKLGAPSEVQTCEACGWSSNPGWRFCKQCGQPSEGITVVHPRQPEPTTHSIVAVPPITSARETECPKCNLRNSPSATRCEVCGEPIGSYAKKLKLKKLLIAASVIFVLILFFSGVAAAGWYSLGIKLKVQTDPAEATIVIDGQEVGRTNSYGNLTTARLRAGDHSLIVTRDGFDEWRQSFNIAFTDFDKSLNIKLNPTKYKLSIVSSPAGSEVLVDNNSMGNTNDSNGSMETSPLSPGEHTVVVRHEGYRDWKQTITLSGDQKLEVTLTTAPAIGGDISSAETEVRDSLEGWAQSSRNRDIDGHMRYYADTLDFYYNRTMVPSSKVREDRTKAFAKFNSIDIQLTNITVQLDSTGQRATVTLDKTFDFRGDNNAFYNGSVYDQILLTKLGGAWLITGEKELKVYYVNK